MKKLLSGLFIVALALNLLFVAGATPVHGQGQGQGPQGEGPPGQGQDGGKGQGQGQGQQDQDQVQEADQDQDQLPPCDEVDDDEAVPGKDCEDADKGNGNNPDGSDPDNPGKGGPKKEEADTSSETVDQPDAAPTDETTGEEDVAPTTDETTGEEDVAPTDETTGEEDVAPTTDETTGEEDVAPTTDETTGEEDVAPTTDETTEESDVAPTTDETSHEEAVDDGDGTGGGDQPAVVEPTPEATPPVTQAIEAAGEIDTSAASNASYTSKVYLANPHAATATFTTSYYPEDNADPATGSEITGTGGSLNTHGGTNFDLANEASVPAGFRGSGVIGSSSELGAVVVEYSGTADVMVHNGIPASQGGATLFAPSAACKYTVLQINTYVGIQNISGSDVTVTVNLYDRERGAPRDASSAPTVISPNRTAYFDTADILGANCDNWLGSAVVNATGGNIVGAANFQYGATNQAFSSELVATGGSVIYFPTAMYNYTSIAFTTFMAVQNTSTTDSVLACVKFFDPAGQKGSIVQRTLGPLEKASVNPGTDAGTGGNFLGAAVANAYSGGSCGAPGAAVDTFVGVINIAAGGDLTRVSSFVGFAGGTQNIVFPFGNWSPTASELDTFFAVQNVGTANATITANYYLNDGTLSGTKTFSSVVSGSKVNPRVLEDLGLTTWVGMVEISSDQPIVGLSTVQPGSLSQIATYNALPFTP